MVHKYYVDTIVDEDQYHAKNSSNCKEFIESSDILPDQDPVIGYTINTDLRGTYFTLFSDEHKKKKCVHELEKLKKAHHGEFKHIIDEFPFGEDSNKLHHKVAHGQ